MSGRVIDIRVHREGRWEPTPDERRRIALRGRLEAMIDMLDMGAELGAFEMSAVALVAAVRTAWGVES